MADTPQASNACDIRPGVVNVRNFPLEWPAPYLYVGRHMPGLFAGSPLGNPFKIAKRATDAERRECLERYRAWLQGEEQQKQLRILAAKVAATGLPLGCWCAPKMCHADVLAEEIARINGGAG